MTWALRRPVHQRQARDGQLKPRLVTNAASPIGLIFVEILLEGIGRFQAGDGAADIPLQLFQMGVHLRKLEASVTEEDLIHLAAFLQQAQEHGGRIFST